jgi:hypothetical protein
MDPMNQTENREEGSYLFARSYISTEIMKYNSPP